MPIIWMLLVVRNNFFSTLPQFRLGTQPVAALNVTHFIGQKQTLFTLVYRCWQGKLAPRQANGR